MVNFSFFFYKLLNFFTMTEFWDKPAEKSGKVLAAFLEGLPLSPSREEIFMEGPIEPNMGQSLADVLLCTFESTNAGFSSFSVRKLLF